MVELHMEIPFKMIRDFAKGQPVFFAGGPVRDWLLGRYASDIDMVVPHGAVEVAHKLARQTGGGFVLLDQGEDVARVVIQGISFDLSGFRKNAKSIQEDLSFRDFTINAMAVPMDAVSGSIRVTEKGIVAPRKDCIKFLIDPFGGWHDLEKKAIRPVALENMREDPLRLLRAFRFRAVLGFFIQADLQEFIRSESKLITRSAPERINYELERLLETGLAGQSLREMFDLGLLRQILPELKEMEGVEQPGFHHLDVLGHCFEAVSCMDKLIMDPCTRFSNCKVFQEWLSKNPSRTPYLKWAAFMHDFGKPSQKDIRQDGRVTFYNHDRKGAEMAAEIASRLRWSRSSTSFVKRLVRMHMRPFHLLNDLRKGGPSKRALRKLLEEIGPDYPALFLLSMADSMAGCGPLKPQGLDDELSRLFDKVHEFYLKRLIPVKKAPPLLNGKDVMKLFSIRPGPLVGQALRAVEARRVEGFIKTREQAIAWLKAHFPDELSVS